MKEEIERIEKEVEVTIKHLLEIVQSLYVQSHQNIKENKRLKKQLQVYKKIHGQKKTRFNR